MKTLLTVRCQLNNYWKGLALLVFSVVSSLSLAQTSDYRGMMEFQKHCATCHESPVPVGHHYDGNQYSSCAHRLHETKQEHRLALQLTIVVRMRRDWGYAQADSAME